MTAAIYYHPDAYTTGGPKLMGRNVAGESFLRGFLAYSKATEFWVQVHQPEHSKLFAQAAMNAGRVEPVHITDKNNLGTLSKSQVLHFPGPNIGELAWQRAAFGHGLWSLCGITHTTSSSKAMDAIAELLTAPVQEWDAVICTSTAVKDNVTRLLQAHADYLGHRLGAQRLVLPQLPVIPLGIHTKDFTYSNLQRQRARQKLAVNASTIVVLYVGRLSFQAKAHPLAMYQALEMAAASLPAGKTLLLVECGWHGHDTIARAFADAARVACPSVRIVTLDGRDAKARETAWAGADVFCSLSDNIQETFGLVPVEAMAAGLPVVVSDWDGYKDTIRDGVDGFRIPTLMPSAGLGTDLALRHALMIDNYDMYCGQVSSMVAVDIDAAAQAFSRLFASPERRRQMGEAGRVHARQFYDWEVIIPQYESLWEQLIEVRKAQSGKLRSLAHPWPARMDPFHGFGSYPTRALTLQTELRMVDADFDVSSRRLSDYSGLVMVNFAKKVLPSSDEILGILEHVGPGPQTAASIVQRLPPDRQGFVFRSLVWLVKLGILAIADATHPPTGSS